MPGVTTTGSTTIAVLDSKIIASLCTGKICVDVTPSIYIGSGKTLVLGANVEIINPFGVTVKPYGSNYEIAPALSGGMDAPICFNIPTQAGNYQYGQYTVNVKMFDDAGNSWVVTKTVKICEPDKNNKTKSYGSLSAQIRGVCKDGKVYIIVDTVPNYSGKTVESQDNDFKIEYPTGSEKDPEETTLGYLSLQLYEGIYKVTGEVCATYNFGDNVFVDVKYKVKKEKNIKCVVDECCVMGKLAELHQRLKTDCTQAEKDETASIAVDALRLLKTAQLAADCGEDASDYITDLEALLGCKCTCNCNEGTPLIPTASSKDFVITGCNVSKESAGLTDTYTIENYAYNVAVTPNGGVIVVSDPVLSDCTKIQTLTFSISAAYAQIRTLADASNGEADFWASIINKALRNLNPSCLGLTNDQWNAKTYYEKIKAITDKMCDCCGGCGATLTVDNISRSGRDVVIEYTPNSETKVIDFYLDGVFKGTVLIPNFTANTFTFEGAADGNEHEYTIVPKCDKVNEGTTVEDTFIFLGCADIAMPSLSQDSVTNAVCPFDLTTMTGGAPPPGITYEWHNANNTNASSIVPDPTSVVGGIYYLFAKDAFGCYSSGIQFTVICSEEESCSAPQILKVGNVSGSVQVKFLGAAYPPPGNSYTVKRKLAGDPDIDGSYTTIGTPVYNGTSGAWEIIDNTALSNVLYTYKAQSNCGGSPGSTPYITGNFAKLTCPSVGFTEGYNAIDYSFVPLGGDIDKYEVKIYDMDTLNLLETDTHTPAFSNPITGTFEYLEPSKDYGIEVIVYIGSLKLTCTREIVTTTAP